MRETLTPEQGPPAGELGPAGGPAVAVTDLRKAFGDTQALVDASLTARTGEIHAIVGENGSGKSTLAKIIGGVLRPDAGTVRVLGVDGAHLGPRQSLTLGVATVYQEVLVADSASVVDNVFLGTDGLFREGFAPAERRRRTEELLSRLTGTDIDPDSLVGALPLSTKQWITIARALVREPKVLILDESTSALDLQSSARLLRELEHRKEQGIAILIVTHRISELRVWADQATVLRDGRTVATLGRTEITNARLLELMGGKRERRSAPVAATTNGSHGSQALTATDLRLVPTSSPLTVEFREGEIVGLAGLEGHGQVRFLEALAGINPADEGRLAVRRDGDLTGYRSSAEAAAAGVVYVPGDRKSEGIFPALSILENFGLPTYDRHTVAGVIRQQSVRRSFNAFSESLAMRLRSARDSIASLSGGNQQKVVIARWLAVEPKVILLNDPNRGVDIGTKQDLYFVFRRLAAEGKTIVFFSSEIEELEGICNRVLVFRDSHVHAEVTGASIRADVILASMFGVGSIDDVIAVEGEALHEASREAAS